MRLRRHWTPAYAWRRGRQALWQRLDPDAPWLPRPAVAFLDSWLRATDRVVELGAGRSTAWLAARVSHVISLEPDPRWRDRVTADLDRLGLDNVDLRSTDAADAASYLAPLSSIDGAVDLVLVDGHHRDHAAAWAVDHIRPGGLVVIDNAERYLPCPVDVPQAIGPDAAPASPTWAAVTRRTAQWRHRWLDDGVSATLVIEAPG